MSAGDRRPVTLDPVSRVTVHLFLVQLSVCLALAAAAPGSFPHSLAAALAVMALLQAGAASHSAPRAGNGGLTEWDGITWLIATACLALALA